VVWLARWWRNKAIDFRFDSSHPPGCSHHQKIVVIDENLAACGGIDISTARWDTPDHRDGDPRRTGPDGKPYMPWHDATMMMRGAVAGELAELGRERWSTATKAKLEPIKKCEDDWPTDLPVMFRDVDIAIARTRAAYDELPEVREIETLYIDMICAAKRFIYFENQYFTSGKIAAAIAARMAEKNPPEIVMVMPRTADGWLEQKAMDGARLKLMRAIGDKDKGNRFRVYVPVTEKRADIYVHAKVSIVDDRLLRVGSSNLNNRSQGLDSECDVIIDAALDANRETPPAMTALRHRLLAEHLDVTPEAFAAAEKKHGSMVDAIDALIGPGKSLELLPMESLDDADEFIASNELLDPESPEAMLDPIGKRGLGKSWAKGKAAIGRRLGRR
jgi:phosphatidylserine/phosphatidylglycerophosphate/cardiolipin synthase-like enzyme